MMKLKKRIKAAWAMLRYPHAWYVCWHKSEDDEPVTEDMLCREAILEAARQLKGIGGLNEERYQMIESVLKDRSVILQSIVVTKILKIPIPYVIYDCESEEDFNELREQEIE